LQSLTPEERLLITERLVQQGEKENDVLFALDQVKNMGKEALESGNESPQLDSQEEEVLKIMSDESENSAIESHNEEEEVEEKKKGEDLDNL